MKESVGAESKSKYVALLALGVLIGVIFKIQAMKTITIGYEDYKLSSVVDDFSVEKIQEEAEPEFTNEKAESQADPTQQMDEVEVEQ